MKKSIILIIGLWLLTACQEAPTKVTKNVECHEPKTQIEEVHHEKYSAEYEECMRLGSPNECIEAELKIKDKELNMAYKEAKKSIPKKSLKKLKEIQREWIIYRDMRCGFYYDAESGSGGLTDSMLCQLEETIKRTDELKELY